MLRWLWRLITRRNPMPPTSTLHVLPDLELLTAAPHRLLFLAGAGNVLLAMAWWTLWLINTR